MVMTMTGAMYTSVSRHMHRIPIAIFTDSGAALIFSIIFFTFKIEPCIPWLFNFLYMILITFCAIS